jgi:hypothetical protein
MPETPAEARLRLLNNRIAEAQAFVDKKRGELLAAEAALASLNRKWIDAAVDAGKLTKWRG